MEESDKKLTRKISPYKIIYPVIIGLGVVSYMLYREFDLTAFEQISFGWSSVFWLSVAVMCMFIRDLGYVIRIRVLSGDRLSWIKSIRIIFLWEFTSAVTPSAIGGTSLAILFVNKEGIKVGRSSAIVMATSFLDELYFILMFPIILLCVERVVGDVGSEFRSKQKPDLVCSGRLFDQAGISFNSELRTFQESPGAEISIDEMFQIKAFT